MYLQFTFVTGCGCAVKVLLDVWGSQVHGDIRL